MDRPVACEPGACDGGGWRAHPEPPLSARVCHVFTVGFALWTLSCHLVVHLEGSLTTLLLVSVLGAVGVAVVVRRMHLQPDRLASGPCVEPRRSPPPPALSPLSAAAIAVGAACALLFVREQNTVLLWRLFLLVGWIAAVMLVIGRQPTFPTARRGRSQQGLLWLVAISCAVLALVAHRPDIDDAFYVNLAVAAVEGPREPLMQGDTLHGVNGLPLVLSVYRVHSYELLNAAVSYLTRVPPIYCFHLVSAALGAVLLPLAYAELFRLLTPRRWIWSVVAVVIVLVASGYPLHWYGNFAFVRMWQGKAIFLSVLTPLIASYGLQFAIRPRVATWLLLAAAQISAVGCSSTALWAAPVTAAIAVASGVTIDLDGAKRLLCGLLASTYPLALGAFLRSTSTSEVTRLFPFFGERLSEHVGGAPLEAAVWIALLAAAAGALLAWSTWSRNAPPSVRLAVPALAGLLLWSVAPVKPGISGDSLLLVDNALRSVLGTGRLFAAGVLGLLFAWTVRRPGLGRRFAALWCTVSGAVLLNPHLAPWLSEHLVGPSYWRVMWTVPVPVVMVLLLTSPLDLTAEVRGRRIGVPLVVLALAAFAAIVPGSGGLSRRNRGLEIAWPRLKVRHPQYLWAERLNRAVPAGSTLLAPLDVSPWIPVQVGHGHPLVVRPPYLRLLEGHLAADDIRRRLQLARYVGGEVTGVWMRGRLREGLARYGVVGVCVRVAPGVDEIRAVLLGSGFKRDSRDQEYEVWVRASPGGEVIGAGDPCGD